MRRANQKVEASTDELGEWLSQIAQTNSGDIVGIVSNTKGVLHEMEFAELENNDGDSVYAAIFPTTNNPGYDVEFTDVASGEVWAVQLKATDSASYVEEWLHDHPEGEIIVTEEIGEELGLPTSGMSNDELTIRTENLVDKLIEANEKSDIWDFLPGIGAIPIALVIWETLQRLHRGEISREKFAWIVTKSTGLKGLKIAGLMFLMTVPGISIVTGAALVFSLIFSTADLVGRSQR